MDIVQAEIHSLREENKNLKAQNTKNEANLSKLREETAQLRATLATSVNTVDNTNNIVKTEKQKLSEANKTIADLTAKTLMLQEENSKITSDNKALAKEYKILKAATKQTTISSETCEEMISSITVLSEEIKTVQTMLSQLQSQVDTSKAGTEADLRLLKAEMRATIRDEVNALKPKEITPAQKPPKGNVQQSVSLQHQSSSSNSVLPPMKSHNKSIFILGDSTTKDLDARRLSGIQYNVTIRTHHNSSIQDIDTKVQSSYIRDRKLSSCDAVLLHTDTTNTGDIDSYLGLISTIKKANNKAKIIVSSIISRKHDRGTSKSVAEINTKLKDTCDNDNQLFYLDNNPQFHSDNRGINSLLFSGEALSRKGTERFARNIMMAIENCLNVNRNNHSIDGYFRQARLKGPRSWNLNHRHQLTRPRDYNPLMIAPPWMHLPQYLAPVPQMYRP